MGLEKHFRDKVGHCCRLVKLLGVSVGITGVCVSDVWLGWDAAFPSPKAWFLRRSSRNGCDSWRHFPCQDSLEDFTSGVPQQNWAPFLGDVFHLRERSDKASCGRPNAIDLPFGDDAFCDAYHPLNQTFYWTVYLLMPRMIGFKKDTLSEDIIYPHDKQLCLDFPLYSHRIPMISLFYLYSMPILSS